MTTRYVYVVAKGERGGKGHDDPEAAYTTLVDAKAHAFTRHDVVPYQHAYGQWRASLNGVDEVWIYRLPLQGGAS